jgi:hypothetical protein
MGQVCLQLGEVDVGAPPNRSNADSNQTTCTISPFEVVDVGRSMSITRQISDTASSSIINAQWR